MYIMYSTITDVIIRNNTVRLTQISINIVQCMLELSGSLYRLIQIPMIQINMHEKIGKIFAMLFMIYDWISFVLGTLVQLKRWFTDRIQLEWLLISLIFNYKTKTFLFKLLRKKLIETLVSLFFVQKSIKNTRCQCWSIGIN